MSDRVALRFLTGFGTVLAALALCHVLTPSQAAESDPDPSDSISIPRGEGRGHSGSDAERRFGGVSSESGVLLGAQTIPQDVPADEIRFGDLFAPLPARDREALIFGKANGEMAVLIVEDFQLQALYSSDGGATFDAEVVAAGDSGEPMVYRGAVATLAGDGTLYAAYRAGDPYADLGVQAVTSHDMGRTWSSPVTLVAYGEPGHGVGFVRVASNASGRVAVGYRDWWDLHPYVTVSSDYGATWTDPVRVDPGLGGTQPAQRLDLEVDGAGIVHVTYNQGRGSGREIWYTRSTDGGQTFESERSMDAVLPAGGRERAENPDMALAGDGSVLIAFWDEYDTDRLYVLRSTDAGLSFTHTHTRSLGDTNVPVSLALFTSPGVPSLMLGVAELADGTGDVDVGPLTVERSTDNGVSFSAPQSLASEATFGGASPSVAMVRTADGNWAAAWADARNDSFFNWMTDIYVSVSTNDGSSWGTSVRVDGDAAGSAASTRARIATVYSDDLVLSYVDRRDDGRDENVYSNRSAAASLDFSTNEQRIDTDARQRNVSLVQTNAVAADGAGHVYVVLQAFTTGPYSDVYVVASADGGYTFATPQKVSRGVAGERPRYVPQIAATSDGYVYAAYKDEDPVTGTQLRFNYSTDYGSTWQPSDRLLGDIGLSLVNYIHPEFHLVALPGGRVYVVWSDGIDVFLARSTDGGQTFVTDDVDQDDRPIRTNGQPVLCAQGDQVVLVFNSRALAGANSPSIWGTVSSDGGENWSTSTNLRSGTMSNYTWSVFPHVDCGDANKAVAVWSDYRNLVYQVYANQFNGSSWQGDIPIGSTPANNEYLARALFTSNDDVLLTYYEDPTGELYTALSTDKGQSFAAPVRRDTGDVNPDAVSFGPLLTTDGLGNVWLSWMEYTSGLASIAGMLSTDYGLNFGSIHRLNRESPQGCHINRYWYGQYSVATAGEAYFTWSGERDSYFYDSMMNAWDLDDFDRDQTSSSTDCNDEDPGVFADPALVTDVDVDGTAGGIEVSWASQATGAGAATVYDVVTGRVSELRSEGGYLSASCLMDDAGEPPYVDTRGDPPPGDADYYLLRAQNSCATASYGDSSVAPDPRDDLDASSPCP